MTRSFTVRDRNVILAGLGLPTIGWRLCILAVCTMSSIDTFAPILLHRAVIFEARFSSVSSTRPSTIILRGDSGSPFVAG